MRSPALRLTAANLSGAGRSLVTKFVALPIAAILGLFTARIAVRGLETREYAIFALIGGLASLLPFTDLGMGAAIVDAVARKKSLGSGYVDRVLLTSFRALAASGLALVLAGWALAFAKLWSPIFGAVPSGSTEIAGGISLTLFGISLPIGLGNRLLTGAGKNHLAVVVQLVAAAFTLVFVCLAQMAELPLWGYAAAPFAAAAIANVLGLRLGMNAAEVRLGPIVSKALVRSVRGERVRHLAGPMAVISVMLPLAYQTDRLVLSHTTSLITVAVYSVGFQLFAPLMGLVGTAGTALWPVFARQRDTDEAPRPLLVYAVAVFAIGGLLASLGLIVLGPVLARFIAGEQLVVPTSLLLSFALLLFIQSACYPLVMFMTDATGLKFQACLHVAMVTLNFPLSVLLALAVGVNGPVLASASALTVTLFIPAALRAYTITRHANGARP